ncbi:phage tail protein [Calidithermus chliarophilus]|uniref:phage tail protein n=1 Tax=Calidithermus chliarophilus TaxID=52023 RepID=UPI000480C4F6|nr:tail fiber protein [Calidithermus chliarophilus]
MSQPFVGEIRMFAGNFAPQGWAFCDGSILPINQYDVLFSLIGTTYGGDGQTDFALPDLRGRVPIHVGAAPGGQFRLLGEAGGAETVTLSVQQIPSHSHGLLASSDTATQTAPASNVLAQPVGGQLYLADAPSVSLNAASLAPAGGSQPHDNMGPFLCVNFIISLFGIYPFRA